MEYLVVLVCFLLIIALVLSIFSPGRFSLQARLIRIGVVVVSIAFFTYWFFQKSVTGLVPNSLALQIINKLPQPLDFYVLTIPSDKESQQSNTLLHPGKIRSEHYRIEYLQMENSNEYWVVGFLGKNVMYFSQHSIQNKNMDQVLEINNYINQSLKLSDNAKKLVEAQKADDLRTGMWVTLSLLLLFLNTALLLLPKKESHH